MNEILSSEPKTIMDLFFKPPSQDKQEEEAKSDDGDMPDMETPDTDDSNLQLENEKQTADEEEERQLN